MPKHDVDLDEDNLKVTEQEVKVEGEFSKSFSWRQNMRALPSHHLPLND